MADAKINIQTMASDEGLKKLNAALADGTQSVKALEKQLKDLEKTTASGTKATEEQAKAMRDLRQSINEQKQANSQYSKAINGTIKDLTGSAKAMVNADKGAASLAKSLGVTEGFTTALSVAMGGLAATIATAVVGAVTQLAGQVVTLGAQMQQSVAHIAAMKNNLGDATAAYQAFNDVGRNTTYSLEAVQQMGIQMMNMGYSAQNAAAMIQLCADTAAGLGQGQEGAQMLVDTLSRIQATGEASSRQMIALQTAGMDLNKAFSSVGMTAEQAMKAMDDGTMDAQTAVKALTNYMHEFDGSMAKSKDNTIDAWGDLTGNISTACAEIGNSIFDAFNQSEIVQELIDFTQSMIDMIRGDGCGAFSDLRAIAGEVLDFIGGLLGFVLDIIKLIIIAVNDAYGAFKSFGAQVVAAVQPAVDVVMALYDAVKSVMSSVGMGFSGEVSNSWRATFGGGSGLDPEERLERMQAARQNNFRSTARIGGGGGGGRSGGGGGGGGRSSAANDTARAEAEAKRQAEEAAKAAKKAYEESYKEIYDAMQGESKTLLDAFMGDPDSAAAKIEAIKEQLAASMETIDKAAAMTMNEGGTDLNPLAAIIGKTPEALQEEMNARGETLAEFVERYKAELAKASEAEASSIKTGQEWHDALKSFALDVAQSMASSMTDFIMGTKSAKDALKDMVKSIIQSAVQILTQWLAVFAIYSAFPMLASGMTPADAANKTVFGVAKKATGGYISGPGTGTSDSVPAMLSNGEYVLRSSAVDRIGINNLNAMNAGIMPHFAEGGAVGGNGGSVTLNVSAMDASSFSGFLQRGGLDSIKQALYDSNRDFTDTVGVW